MNVYTIKNWKTGDIVEITSIYCDVNKHNQFEFGIIQEKNRVIEKLFHTYNWDLINIEYDI